MQNTATDYAHTHDRATDNLDAITHTLERLLTRHQFVLKAEGMDRQVKNLKRWLESNRRNFTPAGNIPKTGSAWLSDVCESLKLAVEERQRLESEGGLPASKEQVDQNEELLSIIHRIENIMGMDSAHR